MTGVQTCALPICDDINYVKKLWNQIREMRRAGLARFGEFSVENLTFKLLRAEGDLKDLKDHITKLKTQEFSLGETHAQY